MSNIACKDPFGYKPGLESGDAAGPSPLNIGELFTSSSLSGGTLKKLSKEITIDSVFSSFTLNQEGGNWTRSGYLYEIWIQGFINDSDEKGNILNGGKKLFLLDLLTLSEYELVIVDTQNVNNLIYGEITKVLVADPLYLTELLTYVNLIQGGEQKYLIGSIPLAEYSNSSVFDIENDIDHKVNFITTEKEKLINLPLLSCSRNTSGSMSLCFSSPESILSYPQLTQGKSLRVQKINNPEDGFEVKINGTPTYVGQINDRTPGDIYYSTFFVSSSIGWSVGLTNEGGPSILKTIDTGTTWKKQQPASLRSTPKSLYFIDQDTGFIAGSSSLFMKTEDSGVTWEEINLYADGVLTQNVNLNAIHGQGDFLWVVGNNGVIAVYDITTETWTLQTSGVSTNLNDVYFVNEDYGWAVGDAGTVIETEDGGTTWVDKTSVSGTTENLYGVHFTSTTRGYACGENGIIIRTNTDGDSWTTRESDTVSSLRSISFINANVGFAVGYSGIITKTINGGITWNSSSIGGYANLYSIQMLSSSNIWVSGDDTYIKNSTNSGSSWDSKYPPNTPINLKTLKLSRKLSLNVIPPINGSYVKGQDLVVSKTLVNIRSGSYGIDYFKAKTIGLNQYRLSIIPTYKPQNSIAAGSKWYIISEVDQINIPISNNYYFSLLTQSEILEYKILNCVSSARLQITKDPKFNKYVFRYKPDNSDTWHYLETSESNTAINNLLPNTIYRYEIMGMNTYTNQYCGFSPTRTFNTFY